MTKLSLKDRENIVKLYETGSYKFSQLAKRYKVSGTVICNVIHNKYPKLIVYWNESAGEKKLRRYAEYYEQKAREYRSRYDSSVNKRLQKELF